MANGRIVQALRVLDQPLFEPKAGLPPGGRAECRNGERPCPYVRCKFHLWLQAGLEKSGRVSPGTSRRDRETVLEPRWLEYPTPACCELDVIEARAGRGELMPFRQIGELINRDGDVAGKAFRSAQRKLKAAGVDKLLGIERTPGDDE